MRQFKIGQRWLSESEPELGLGIIVEVDSKTVTCLFPAAKVDRKYGSVSAPLRRISFEAGDEITSKEGTQLTVESYSDSDGILTYFGQGKFIQETQLADTLTFSRPTERLFVGNVDSSELFKLRYDVLLNLRKLFLSSVRGFIGPRLSIIPHQLFVASEVTKRARPRVLLADEVGLGKTIEAGLILHQLILTGRVERCLILVPDSLVYQWFVEMLRKFQLTFKTINHESHLENGDRPFEESQLFVVSLKYLLKEDWLLKQAIDTDWDLLIVDEAHQLRWSPENSSPEYSAVSTLSKDTPGVLLLSGTPEILGLAGHFARLHLLDPDRFSDYNQFIEESLGFRSISALAKKIINGSTLSVEDRKILKNKTGVDFIEKDKTLQMLVDRHGTGRIYFRNTRKTMASYAEFFPLRVFHPYPIKGFKSTKNEKKNFEVKAMWLAEFVNKHPKDKILLICHDKDVALNLEKILKSHTTSTIAIFHSGMNLMNRDRQAAYFADPQGANILLSTEIGSEGRNFEFAQHLVLFDLPRLPDLLEQRIGRLDRIGQKNNIQIHLPFLEASAEEILMRWYHEGLNAFETSPKGATEVYASVREQLLNLIAKAEEGDFSKEDLFQLIEKTKLLHVDIEKKLEEGQDLLVEINSFNHQKAMAFVKEFTTVDESTELREFMLNLWNQLGVDAEDMNDPDTFFIKPGDNMYLPHFPGLPGEGMMVTFKRGSALKREDVSFLTWDHPMVLGIMDFVSSKEMGNVTVVSAKSALKEKFLLEAYFVLSAIGEKKLQIQRWFPPTPLRVLLNSQFQDLTAKIPKKFVDEHVEELSVERRSQLKELPKEFIKECIKAGKDCVLSRARQFKDKFKDEMLISMNSEIERLESLRKYNPLVSESEIILLRYNRDKILSAMEKADLSLDSIRIIIQ